MISTRTATANVARLICAWVVLLAMGIGSDLACGRGRFAVIDCAGSAVDLDASGRGP